MGIDVFRHAAALAFVTACVLTACSGGSQESGSTTAKATEPDACSFLTAQAVSAAIGKTVPEGRKTNEAGGGEKQGHMTTCTWQAEVKTEGTSAAQLMRDSVAVTLILWSWPNAKSSADYIESFRKVAQETGQPTPTALSLGEESIREGTDVHVRKGDRTFTVSVHVFGDADQAAAGRAAETLAEQVVAKL